jgi:hypothetical protein
MAASKYASLATLATCLSLAGAALASPSSIYDFSALQYEQEVSLAKYKGQVLVIVNIASE